MLTQLKKINITWLSMSVFFSELFQKQSITKHLTSAYNDYYQKARLQRKYFKRIDGTHGTNYNKRYK